MTDVRDSVTWHMELDGRTKVEVAIALPDVVPIGRATVDRIDVVDGRLVLVVRLAP